MDIKLGDKIYFFNRGKYPIYREEITKITRTMYKTKNYTLKVDGEYVRVLGQNIWSMTTAQLENPTNKELYIEGRKISWFDNYKFKVEDKIKVYDLLTNPSTHKG